MIQGENSFQSFQEGLICAVNPLFLPHFTSLLSHLRLHILMGRRFDVSECQLSP